MIKGRISGALLLPVAAMLAGAIPAAIAQDALPEVSDALRDFKLEPEPPAPKPQPLPPADPGEASPVTPRQPPNSPAPNSNTQEPPQIKVAAPEVSRIKAPSASPAIAPRPEQKPVGAGAKPQAVVGPASGEDSSVQAPTVQNKPQSGAIGAQAGEPESQKEGDNPLANDLPWEWIVLGLLALAAAIGAVIGAARLIRKSRKKQSYTAAGLPEFDAETTAYEAAPTAPSAPVPAAPRPMQNPKAPVTATPAKRALLEIVFVPGKATISLANLTIEGKLHIENIGDAPAKSMQLHAAIISASETQDSDIERFFELGDANSERLDGAEIGEKVALDLNLAVPLSEITAFASGTQKLLVPIILVRIVYLWGNEGQASDVQLSCLIGREASPPKPKMGALRLDLGPRSFGSLGQRPVFG